MLAEALSLLFDTAASGVLKRAVFSRPENGDGSRVSARLCTHKGDLLLATEKQAKDGKVYHKNLPLASLAEDLLPLASPYMQINIITSLGDAEYKRSENAIRDVFKRNGIEWKRVRKKRKERFVDGKAY